KEDFLSVVEALFKSYPKIQVKRLVLRYVDNIDIPNESPTEWDKYLKPELNTIFALAGNRETISRAFHVLEFNYGEDFLRFQFGMFNPDYPAPIKKKIYTLDFDMYVTKILNKTDIEETLDRFHEKVSEFFEEVITDELRKIMEPIDE
ncbi:MAG: TIGR04255 family protein, partial [Gammaproteobacteria bacterium]|nr:TIGR04255 family protein [Gammaproteobacteria bacterium]